MQFSTVSVALVLLLFTLQGSQTAQSIPPKNTITGPDVVARERANALLHPQILSLRVRTADQGAAILNLKKRHPLQNVLMETKNSNGEASNLKRSYSDHGHYINDDNSGFISSRLVKLGKRQKIEYRGHFAFKRSTYEIQPTKSGHAVRRIGSAQAIEKRSGGKTQIIEYCAVLDYTVYQSEYKKHNNREKAIKALTFRYQHIFNGMDIAYKSIPDENMSISIVKFVIQEDRGTSSWTTESQISGGDTSNFKDIIVYASKTLKVMTKFMSSNEAKQSYKCDHLALFTKADLANPKDNKYPVGLATLGEKTKDNSKGACLESPVSVVEDQGFITWLTSAHEMGHNFGAQHDGKPYAPECTQLTYVMAPMAATDIFTQENIGTSLRFSKCSAKMIKHYISQLNKFNANCLLKQENSGVMKISNIKAGSGYTFDEMCKLEGFSKFCPDMYLNDDEKLELEKTCMELYCVDSSGECYAGGARALPGAMCAKGKTCNWEGHCVTDPTAVTPTGPGFSVLNQGESDENTCEDSAGAEDCAEHFKPLTTEDSYMVPCLAKHLCEADKEEECCVTRKKMCKNLRKPPARAQVVDKPSCVEEYPETCNNIRKVFSHKKYGECYKNRDCAVGTYFVKNCCNVARDCA